jgi:ATP-dependent RNA helicase DDX46/PRP5
LKPDLLKNAAQGKKPTGGAMGAMDDYTESTRKLERLGDMPDVDLTMDENGEKVGDNLEAGDDDDDVLDKPATKMDVDEDEEEDPLDAFMSSVKQEVALVEGSDVKKQASSRLGARVDDNEDDQDETPQAADPDEIDVTNLNPEEILAYVFLFSIWIKILTLFIGSQRRK